MKTAEMITALLVENINVRSEYPCMIEVTYVSMTLQATQPFLTFESYVRITAEMLNPNVAPIIVWSRAMRLNPSKSVKGPPGANNTATRFINTPYAYKN